MRRLSTRSRNSIGFSLLLCARRVRSPSFIRHYRSIDMSEQPYIPPPHGWRTFLIVWATQSISVFGSALTLFAITIWLTQTIYPRSEQQANLAFALAAVSLGFGLPTVLAGLVAGAWVDRHDRRLTMLATDLVSGLLSLALLALMASGTLNLWLLLLLVLLFSTSTAFHGAAFDTSYAML